MLPQGSKYTTAAIPIVDSLAMTQPGTEVFSVWRDTQAECLLAHAPIGLWAQSECGKYSAKRGLNMWLMHHRQRKIIVQGKVRFINKISLEEAGAQIPQQRQGGGVFYGAGDDLDVVVQGFID